MARIKIFFLYHFRLKPRIKSMRGKINQLIADKQDCFCMGKSLLEFPADQNTIYFIVYKDQNSIRVIEIYDSWIRKVPEKYKVLEKVWLNNIL